jgi:hypothetical protein
MHHATAKTVHHATVKAAHHGAVAPYVKPTAVHHATVKAVHHGTTTKQSAAKPIIKVKVKK